MLNVYMYKNRYGFGSFFYVCHVDRARFYSLFTYCRFRLVLLCVRFFFLVVRFVAYFLKIKSMTLEHTVQQVLIYRITFLLLYAYIQFTLIVCTECVCVCMDFFHAETSLSKSPCCCELREIKAQRFVWITARCVATECRISFTNFAKLTYFLMR